MALVACPDCGRSVSDQAPICPSCGLPVAAHFRGIREEEEARKALEEAHLAEVAAQRSKDLQTIVVVVIGDHYPGGVAESLTAQRPHHHR